MRRSLSRIVALLAPIFMLGVFFASPASAHHTTVSGEVECVQGEGYLITWTIQNSENIGGTADVSASAGALSSTSVALPANRGSVQVITTHAVAETVTLTVSAEWTNKVKSVDTGKVKASDFPECDEPDDDYQIQPEKSWLIDGAPATYDDLPSGSWVKIVIWVDIVGGGSMTWTFDDQGRDHDGWLSYGAGMPVVIDEEYYVPGYSCEPVDRIFSGDDLVTVTVVNDCTEDDTPPQKVPNNPEYNRIEDCGWIEFTLTNNVELGDNEYAEPAEFTIEFKGDVETYTVPANGDPIVLTYSVEEDAGDEDIVINGNVYTIESDCLPDEEPEPPVVNCDTAAVTGSVASWLSDNGFDGSDCFDWEVSQSCGIATVLVTEQPEPGYASRFRAVWVEGDGSSLAGYQNFPAEFPEGYNNGEVTISWFLVGPEKDWLVGTDAPNFWDGTSQQLVINTNCEEEPPPPPPPPVDECPDMPGNQSSKDECPPPVEEECPEGQVGTPPNCETPVTPPTDVCPNVDGIQTEVPDGMFRNADGFCFPEEQPEPPAPPTPGGTLPRTGGGFGLIPLAVGFLLTGGAIRRLSKRQLA